MIQAFYTASAGLRAQQKSMDVSAHNISNINTPGYRVKRAEFRELLDLQIGTNNDVVATGFGAGVLGVSTQPLPSYVNPLGMTIQGDGYFVVQDDDGRLYYTKDGDFRLREEGGRYYLSTRSGEYVLDTDGNRIEMTDNPEQVVVSKGLLYPQGNCGENGVRLALVKFEDMDGLAHVGQGKYVETGKSGGAANDEYSTVIPNYYEELAALSMANQANEIARIIQAQMAYQYNSKVLQIADEIEGMANHLRY